MTSRSLAALGRRIMKRFEMHEWLPKAEFRMVRNLKSPDGYELYGQAVWHSEERHCWISVSIGLEEKLTIESLIHEILHVLLEGHSVAKTKYDASYELALNRMASALAPEWMPRK